MKSAFSVIAIQMRPEWRHFMIALARRLKREHGSVIHLYCGQTMQAHFYRGQNSDGLFASINVCSLLDSAQEKSPGFDEVIGRASENEAWLKKTYNSLMLSNRHFGRGFALGGFHHPRSRYSETLNYRQIVHAYNKIIDYWREEFTVKGVSLLIDGTTEAAVVARIFGIEYRTLATSRYKNFHYWGRNEFLETPDIEVEFRRTDATLDDEIELPYLVHMAHRKLFLREIGLSMVARDLFLQLSRHIWWRIRGYEKARGYYLRERLTHLIRRRRQWLELKRLSVPLSALANSRFVYYPLHTEPEKALQGQSPEYFYQLSCIAAVARDLPVGVYLAVKEIYLGVGRRPDEFYRQIAEFKNVVLIDPEELGPKCIAEAAAVVTICGTGGFEAGIMGRPVIAFGQHNIYNILPHVTVITDESRLRHALVQALDPAFDRAKARAIGARFLRAVVHISFDLGRYDFINLTGFDDSVVEAAHRSLKISVSA